MVGMITNNVKQQSKGNAIALIISLVVIAIFIISLLLIT